MKPSVFLKICCNKRDIIIFFAALLNIKYYFIKCTQYILVKSEWMVGGRCLLHRHVNEIGKLNFYCNEWLHN